MKKTRKLLFCFLMLTLVLSLGLIISGNSNNAKADTSVADRSEVIDYTSTAATAYLRYVDEAEKYHEAVYGNQTYCPSLTESIKIYGSDYIKTQSSIADMIGSLKAIEDVSVKDTYEDSESAAAGKDTIVYQRGGDITYEVNIETPGFYNIYITYYTITGLHSNIDRTLKINGEYPFDDCSSFTFTRVWQDQEKTIDDTTYNVQTKEVVDGNYIYSKLWRTDTEENQLKPQQVENIGTKVVSPFKDSMGYVTEPFKFYFDKGVSTITLGCTKEYFGIDCIEIREVEEVPTYAEYEADLLKEHGVSSRDEIKGATNSYTRIEAESTTTKSSPTLYPVSDRSDPNTTPFSIMYTSLNTIGGDSWSVLGDWIAWNFQVPESGFYEISMRAKQNVVRGMFSTRSVSIATVDDDGTSSEYEYLFSEMDNVQIAYDNDWKNETLGGEEEPYLFYFEAGVTYSLKMEVTLGDYALLIAELQNIIDELSEIYREIIAYTTLSPDSNRTYDLDGKFPYLFHSYDEETGTYSTEKDGKFYELLNELTDISETIKEISGGGSDKTGVIDSVVVILQKMIDKPTTIPQRLSTYSTNVSSLGSLLNELREAPLAIDYIEIHTPDVTLPKAKANFFKGLWTDVVKFFASFFINYENINETEEAAEENITIEVWMTLGRDQANVIRNLIDTTFTNEYGINVDLKLTGSDVLLKATLAGIGPDVALNVDSTLPVNYALRNAVYDLTNYDDFWDSIYCIPDGYTLEDVQTTTNDELPVKYALDISDAGCKNVYMASALRQFQFSYYHLDDDLFDSANYSAEYLKENIKEIYALPEKQSFLMMFVRDDIMVEYCPEGKDYDEWLDNMTWSDMIELVAKLQAKQLQYYLPVNDTGATALNPVFVSLLYQYGGNLYINDNTESGLKEEAAMEAFEYWTELYTNYSFPTSASFVNRFRTGEMPIGVSYYDMYNTLSVFAPELKGKWSFHLIPGYETEEGIDHTATVSGTGAVILKQAVTNDDGSQNEKAEPAWEFLKWWTGYNTQYQFGTEMEGILGSAARHNTANVLALDSLAWPTKDKEMLMAQWAQVHEMPQIAGSYITGREIENAYREVINNLYNPREILYEYSIRIKDEIDRKRSEFSEYLELSKAKYTR